MSPRPPSSTLFPYTTLFRSEGTDDSRLALGLDELRPRGDEHGGAEDGQAQLGEQVGKRVHGASLGRRSEEHTSELQSRGHLVCRLLLEKKKRNTLKRIDQLQ